MVSSTESCNNKNYEYIIYHKFTYVTKFYNTYNHKSHSNPVINAAGLTILYTQNDNTARVNISRCTFKENLGSTAGAMLVLHLNTNTLRLSFIMNQCSTQMIMLKNVMEVLLYL